MTDTNDIVKDLLYLREHAPKDNFGALVKGVSRKAADLIEQQEVALKLMNSTADHLSKRVAELKKECQSNYELGFKTAKFDAQQRTAELETQAPEALMKAHERITELTIELNQMTRKYDLARAALEDTHD